MTTEITDLDRYLYTFLDAKSIKAMHFVSKYSQNVVSELSFLKEWFMFTYPQLIKFKNPEDDFRKVFLKIVNALETDLTCIGMEFTDEQKIVVGFWVPEFFDSKVSIFSKAQMLIWIFQIPDDDPHYTLIVNEKTKYFSNNGCSYSGDLDRFFENFKLSEIFYLRLTDYQESQRRLVGYFNRKKMFPLEQYKIEFDSDKKEYNYVLSISKKIKKPKKKKKTSKSKKEKDTQLNFSELAYLIGRYVTGIHGDDVESFICLKDISCYEKEFTQPFLLNRKTQIDNFWKIINDEIEVESQIYDLSTYIYPISMMIADDIDPNLIDFEDNEIEED